MSDPARQLATTWAFRELIALSLGSFLLLCFPRFCASCLEVSRLTVRVVGGLMALIATVVAFRNFGGVAALRYLLSAGAIGAVLVWLDLRDRDPR